MEPFWKSEVRAADAYALTAYYDSAIAGWFAAQAGNLPPQLITFGGTLVQELRYGENPHQKAAFYRTHSPRYGVATAKQLQGKELSYNNIGDADAAYECVAEFDHGVPTVVIAKHANPCGVGQGKSLIEAYRKALDCDSTSAFGGVVALNRELDAETARSITEIFTEVIIVPGATEEALRIVAQKKEIRLLIAGGLPDPKANGLTFKSVAGGLLVQSRDNKGSIDLWPNIVTKRGPTADEARDLYFAWNVAKHVKSNAIVYAKNLGTTGIGAGQMSRVDSAYIAKRKGEAMEVDLGTDVPLLKGSVAASDAFFPFADGLLACVEAGVTAVIQPGGSKRDEEVIKAANDHNIAMVFTATRHFRH